MVTSLRELDSDSVEVQQLDMNWGSENIQP
jgi:hypothetical protein